MAQQIANASQGVQVQQYTVACSTRATDGDGTAIIAAPGAGVRAVIKELVVQNESSTATTVLVKSGSTTLLRAALGERQSLTVCYAVNEELRCGVNEAIYVNLSGANSHGYHVRYFTESA